MAHITLQDILQQIDSCGFQCEAGDLRNNEGYQQLIALASEAEKYREAYYQSQGEMDALKRWDSKYPPFCTCHPSDNPPVPCARRYALSECVQQAIDDNSYL